MWLLLDSFAFEHEVARLLLQLVFVLDHVFAGLLDLNASQVVKRSEAIGVSDGHVDLVL